MATHQHQERAAHRLAGVAAPSTKRTPRTSADRPRNGQWERRIEADWQGHLQTLRQWIGELLIKNQDLR
jgi:hypothetical protein